VTLIEQIRDASINVPLLSADGWADENIVDASKQKGVKGIYFTTHRFLGVDTPGMMRSQPMSAFGTKRT